MTTLASGGGLSGGEVAALIVAVFWGVLVCFLAFVLVKLGQVIGNAGKLVNGVTDQTVPLIGEVTNSVVHVNAELERVDAIAANVQAVSGNASALSAVIAATFGSPLIRVASFSYAVRHAVGEPREQEIARRSEVGRRGSRERRGARRTGT